MLTHGRMNIIEIGNLFGMYGKRSDEVKKFVSADIPDGLKHDGGIRFKQGIKR